MKKSQISREGKMTEREIFALAICVDSIWSENPNLLNQAKDRFFQAGWMRSFSILLAVNRQLLAFLEKSGNVSPTPTSLSDLSVQINSWLPPAFQIPGDNVIESIYMILYPDNPDTQKYMSENTLGVALNWLIVMSGLISYAAEVSDYDPYTVMLKTFFSLKNIP